jgi:hypothetical protein
MLSDTSPEAERVWIELWRQMTPQDRLQRTFRATAEVIAMSRAGLARARPELTDEERNLLWVEIHYGRPLAEKLREHLAKRKS